MTNSRDALHAQALSVGAELDKSGAMLITSDWVLTEFLNSASRLKRRGLAIAAVQGLKESPTTTVLAAARADWTLAFALYRAAADKEWSLVDCMSILACRRLGIKRVFTHDRHFRQAGFEILLK